MDFFCFCYSISIGFTYYTIQIGFFYAALTYGFLSSLGVGLAYVAPLAAGMKVCGHKDDNRVVYNFVLCTIFNSGFPNEKAWSMASP